MRKHPQFFKAFIERGWTVTQGRKAWKLRHPVYGLVACSLTPSCPFYESKVIKDVTRKERQFNEACYKRVSNE